MLSEFKSHQFVDLRVVLKIQSMQTFNLFLFSMQLEMQL